MPYISTLPRYYVNRWHTCSFVKKFVQNESFGHKANYFCDLELTSILLGNTGDKTLQETSFKTFINGVGNDLKMATDDLIDIIITIKEDVEKIKVKTSKPDKLTALVLLEYIGMEEGKAKKNMEILCSKEINQYLKWIDNYCEENDCTQEDVLNKIIREEI